MVAPTMTLQARTIEELKADFTGEILRPSDRVYEHARKIWNAMIDERPALIVRCATPADVVRGVTFARDSGLPLAVRAAGTTSPATPCATTASCSTCRR